MIADELMTDQTVSSTTASPPLLIMIGYEVSIGFAIGRLISTFYEMGTRVTGRPEAVHFAFTRIGGDRSAALPPGFDNLVEFDGARWRPEDLTRLLEYVTSNDIRVLFGLDVPVEAAFLRPLRRAGVRVVISYCGAPCSSLNSGLRLALKRLEVALLRRDRPDEFILESEAMRRTAVFGRGISRRCTTVVPTGVNVEKFAPRPGARQTVYETFEIPRHRRIIVYMGHLHERKGVQVLLRAADRLAGRDRREDIHFLFLGNRADEIDAFRHCFDSAVAGPFITFGGYRDNIPELLAGCYAGCIPSTGWDSYPMSSLEMQACGLPVIASDCQGVPETIADGVTGIVTRADDTDALARTIVSLVDDPMRREQMGYAARHRIEQSLTREHQAATLTQTVRDVIARVTA